MKVGLIGFGKTGRAIAAVLLESKFTNLQWVIRQSTTLEHRSVPEFLGIKSDEPATLARLKSFQDKTVVMHSPNITLGINFLLIAAKILKNIAPYTDIEIIEEHFKKKPEVSGTAKIIARELGLTEDAIKTVRAGGIIGTHEILFGFPFQTVRLKHESISREAFGNGILFAVEQLIGKPKGFYSMEDLLLPFFKLREDEKEITAQNRKPWWKFWIKP
jgi:4-hydroxy-tetrahydrodipicolinate reductase